MISQRERVDRLDYLSRKYGKCLFVDLEKVKTAPFYTLSWLGSKHGFSREYARQIFWCVYGLKYSECLKLKNRILGENTSCIHNPKRKLADWKKGSNVYKGAQAENLFMVICEGLGFSVGTPKTPEIDIVVNNFLVDVKMSATQTKSSYGTAIRYHRFGMSAIQRELCHFFACYIESIDSFFIIPNKENGIKCNKPKSIYISKTVSGYYAAKNKYNKYKNRFDLLSGKQLKPDEEV